MSFARMLLYVFVTTMLASPVFADDASGEKVEATTAVGDKVILYPNGRWEFVDTQKAEAAKEVARQYPENQGCPPGWRGSLLGFGRCVPPGDKDYNRGSMIGK